MPARIPVPVHADRLLPALLCLALLVAAPSWAAGRAASAAVAPATATAPGGPNWSSLSTVQRAALLPLASEWDAVDSVRKQKWLEIAARFPAMTKEEQGRVHERMAEWVRMTPQQRTQARINFQLSRDVSKEERQARWEAYQALPDDKKQELAKRAAPASAASMAAAARPKVVRPVDEVQVKSNLVRPAAAASSALRPVSPVVVQARPGATTNLLTTPVKPPPHQQAGQPKIAGGPADVDGTTLLPKRGPQATPMAPSSAPPVRPKVVAPALPVAPSTPGTASVTPPATAASRQ